MSSLAYFMSKDTIDHFNTIVKPIVYLSMFYFFNNPRSSIWENYVVLLALVYCVTGIGYTFAIFFQPSSAQLVSAVYWSFTSSWTCPEFCACMQWSALLPVVLTLIATQQKNTIFADLCYTKWALEAFVIANAQKYAKPKSCYIIVLYDDELRFLQLAILLVLFVVAAIPGCG
jgi:hypothetical protein